VSLLKPAAAAAQGYTPVSNPLYLQSEIIADIGHNNELFTTVIIIIIVKVY